MAKRVRPPSRFVAWLGISIVVAVVATSLNSTWQLVFICVALLPALAVSLRALQLRRPSLGQTISLSVILLLVAGQPTEAAIVLTIGEVTIVILDLFLRTHVIKIQGAVASPAALVRVERLNREELVPYTSLRAHERVIVNPGERVPIDGRLINRSARVRPPFDLDQLDHVAPGELVIAGSLAVNRIIVDAQYVGVESTLAVLRAHLQRVTQQLPPPLVRLDRLLAVVQLAWSVGIIAGYFVAIDRVWVAWLSLCGVWWLGTLLGRLFWLKLVSTAARRGVLITSWEAVLRSRNLRNAVLSKTGTVSTGTPHLLEVLTDQGFKREDVLRIALALERASDHPIAHALKHVAVAEQLAAPEPEQIQVMASMGIIGTVEQESFAVGSSPLMSKLGLTIPAEFIRQAKLRESQGATTVYVANRERVVGLLILKDVVRPSAVTLVRELNQNGFSQIQLVSGDSSLVSRSVAATVGIPAEQVFARMSAARKEQHVKQLPRNETVVIAEPQSDQAMLAGAGLGIAFSGFGPSLRGTHAQLLVQRADLSSVAPTLNKLKRLSLAWWSAPVIGAFATALASATLVALRFF